MGYDLASIRAIIQNDYLYVDGTQPVTYYVRLSDAVNDFADPATATALKREAHKTEGFGGDTVEVLLHTVDWILWTASMSSPFTPRRGDKFTDSESQNWEVLDVDEGCFRTRWRLACKAAVG